MSEERRNRPVQGLGPHQRTSVGARASLTTALAPSGLFCAPRVRVSGSPGSDKPGEAL